MCAFAFVFNSFCSENALNNWFRVVVVVAVCPRKLVIVTCHLNDDQTRSRIQHFKQHLQAFLPPLRKQCAIFVKRHHIWRNAVTANVWKLTASTAFSVRCVCIFCCCCNAEQQTNSDKENKIFACNSIIGIVHLIWYTSEQITCIFCTIYACKRNARIVKCLLKECPMEMERETKSNKINVNGKVDPNYFMKLMRFQHLWHSNCWNNWQ